LIDRWGNESTIEQDGTLDRIKHHKVLAVLEKRSLHRRYGRRSIMSNTRAEDSLDETGTVDTADFREGEHETEEADRQSVSEVRQMEVLSALGVNDEVLSVHGTAPGAKGEGVTRLIYENLDGLRNKICGNVKLEKMKTLIDDLEADIACFNEHKQNLMHKDNVNGFSQLFQGGEAEVRSVAAHNRHEGMAVGRRQEGGTAALVFGQLVEQYDFESSGRDELGLGRWVVLVFRGSHELVTRVVCGYCPCVSRKQATRSSYQQARRFYIQKEQDLTCPRIRFRQDLIAQLQHWRNSGDRIVVCLDANSDIYKKELGQALVSEDGLNMSEVVGDYTGKQIGPTFFRGQKPIDGVWATKDLQVVNACVMPAGFGVGDHRMFVVDFRTQSLVGSSPPKVVRMAARRLNTKIPRVAERYVTTLERLTEEHRLNSRLITVASSGLSKELVRWHINKIDQEANDYMRRAERKCRKIRNGRIPFSPEAAIWIRRRQVYESLLRRLQNKIKNWSNLRRSAQRCGILRPFSLGKAEIKTRLQVCEEKCGYFERHGHSFRRKHLQRRLTAAQVKNNTRAEEQILGIIKRERERAFWRRLNYAMDKRSGRSVTRVQVVEKDGSVRESGTKREVEATVFSEIHGKRFYLAEQAPICKGKLRGDFGYMADTTAGEEVLSGTYPLSQVDDVGTRDIMDEIARLRQIVPANSVDLRIRHPKWRAKWQGAKERTSSSHSGLHFSHYIAGAKSPLLSHHHSLKASICATQGLALDRWKQGLTCMLEKSPGNCLVTKLRAILLMEADFNATNKIVFGERMMEMVRRYNLMEDEVFSERGRTAEDGALSKVLFYDIVRQTRLSAAISSVDASNCYDSVAHAIASLIFQAMGVPVEGAVAMLEAIQDMKYFLRTAYGDSSNFANSKIEVKYQGLCQGNGAAPAGWAVISITILRAHKRRGHGATFVCPVTQLQFVLSAVLFVDDCDLIHIDMATEESVSQTFARMQASVLNWGRLLIATGGSYKPEKCFFHLLSFQWNHSGKWQYAPNHEVSEYEMVVPLPDGTNAPIEHLPVTQVRETLGVWSSPDGNPSAMLTKMSEKGQAWVDQAKEGGLRQRDVWLLLDIQFWPRVGYGICCNTAPHSKLEHALDKQYYRMLPLGGVVRTAPAAARQLHRGFYGIGCPHPGIKCFQSQISKLLMHYGCNSSLGKKMAISLRSLVLELGLSLQPFQEPFGRYKDWVTWSWMTSIWEKCSLYNVRIEFLDTNLKFPRERDCWLMQRFLEQGYSTAQLLTLNRVRKHQQVIFLSCVLNALGSDLDGRYLHRRPDGQKWSELKFPKEHPSPSDFRLWREALGQIIPPGGVSVRLGRCLHIGYKIWDWRVCREEGYLLHYQEGSMEVYQLVPHSNRRWVLSQASADPEVIGNPCSVRELGNGHKIITSVAPTVDAIIEPITIRDVIKEWRQGWFWRKLEVVGDDSWLATAIAAGTVLAVADGSYIKELFPNANSCAFVLECQEGRGRILGRLVEGTTDACAYRGELLGLLAIHLILKAVNTLQPTLTGSVRIGSDCLGALGRVTSLPGDRLPSGIKHSDILKVLMIHCNNYSFDCDYVHVHAHQDDREEYGSLSRISQLNCCMDLDAKGELWELVGQPSPAQSPLPLEPVVVMIGRHKMTSGSEDSLVFWCNKLLARRTLADPKLHWLDEEQFEEIYWPACYQALTEAPRMFQLFAAKQSLGIAGCNVNQSYYTPGHDRRCPSCRVEMETCGHILMCNEAGRVEVLHRSIDLLDRWLQTNGTEQRLRHFIIQYAHGRGGRTMHEIVGFQQEYRRLAASVDCIGWRRFMEGMLSVELVELQKYALVESDSRLTIDKWAKELVIRLLEITHGQWLYRNVMVHDRTEGDLVTKRKEDLKTALEEQLELGEDGLEEEDKFLLEINLDELEASSGEDQTYWLLALEAARDARLLRAHQEGESGE
jgi:hypothetical protein